LVKTPTRASSTYRLVGENTNKGFLLVKTPTRANATRSGKGSESGRKCYAEWESERERVIPIVLLVKTPTRANATRSGIVSG
jgi:hypothetical protein